MNKPTNILATARDIFLFIESLRDWIPDFETRMINREKRFRVRYEKGKISQERLAIELQAIELRRKARNGG